MPLLWWHRFPRLSRAYMWFALAFVVGSLASHWLLGECFFTTLARKLWLLSGGYRGSEPFTALLANTVAGLRPTRREVVLAWELAVLVTSISGLRYWHNRNRTGKAGPKLDETLHSSE